MLARLRRIAPWALIALIVVAHVALWRAPDVPIEAKWRLTLLNAAGWAVILLPAWGVSLWLGAVARRNREGGVTRRPVPAGQPDRASR